MTRQSRAARIRAEDRAFLRWVAQRVAIRARCNVEAIACDARPGTVMVRAWLDGGPRMYKFVRVGEHEEADIEAVVARAKAMFGGAA